MKIVTVKKNDAGQRIDRFMSKLFTSMPQSLIYKSLRKDCVKVNGKHVKEGFKLSEGDEIRFYIKDEFFEQKSAEHAFLSVTPHLDIVYEDENILLTNKPVGMVVHEDESGTPNTLIAHIQAYLYQKGEYKPEDEQTFAPALCNRIDRNTSGIVICAKNAEALRIINQKIKDRELTKMYLCLAFGKFDKKSAVIEGYLKKDERTKTVTVTDRKNGDAKQIRTKYTVLGYKDGVSLVEVDLLTGRTHQIRAHLAHIGHPLVGDGKYGKNADNKRAQRKYQALCSYKLTFKFTTDAGILNYLNNKTFSVKNVDFAKEFNTLNHNGLNK